MSFYNMINGATPATFFILPLLGNHPDTYPRFRDCFTADDQYPEYDNHIHIYTRVGGGNREYYQEKIDKLRSIQGYVTDFDDSEDSTYATFVFRVPVSFQDDFDKISVGNIGATSTEYRTLLYKVYPKLKSKFDMIFNIDTI